jgi:hypothetical protein
MKCANCQGSTHCVHNGRMTYASYHGKLIKTNGTVISGLFCKNCFTIMEETCVDESERDTECFVFKIEVEYERIHRNDLLFMPNDIFNLINDYVVQYEVHKLATPLTKDSLVPFFHVKQLRPVGFVKDTELGPRELNYPWQTIQQFCKTGLREIVNTYSYTQPFRVWREIPRKVQKKRKAV